MEQDKKRLEQEKAKLAQDNTRLTQDYQAVDRKCREEAGKVKVAEDRARLLERKLEGAGLGSKGKEEGGPVATSANNTLISDARYKPTLQYLIFLFSPRSLPRFFLFLLFYAFPFFDHSNKNPHKKAYWNVAGSSKTPHSTSN